MLEAKVGPVRFAVSSDCLVVEDSNQSQHPVSLSLELLPRLVEFLQSIDCTRRTRAFRVPLDDEAGLQVTIVGENESWVATPHDISLVGVSVTIEQQVALSVDSEVTVHLKLSDRRATLPAVVRRVQERAYGIEFVDCYLENSLSPPEELRQIVAPLEIRFIRSNRNR
ncbi:MAG: PilZ domain-containing protein [Planctomycetaceae bacterium]